MKTNTYKALLGTAVVGILAASLAAPTAFAGHKAGHKHGDKNGCKGKHAKGKDGCKGHADGEKAKDGAAETPKTN